MLFRAAVANYLYGFAYFLVLLGQIKRKKSDG